MARTQPRLEAGLIVDITEEDVARIRFAAGVLAALPVADRRTFAGRLAVDQYVALATPERVVALLDLAEHMTEAVEKINGMVAAAGFSNLEAALAAFARVGRQSLPFARSTWARPRPPPWRASCSAPWKARAPNCR